MTVFVDAPQFYCGVVHYFALNKAIFFIQGYLKDRNKKLGKAQEG